MPTVNAAESLATWLKAGVPDYVVEAYLRGDYRKVGVPDQVVEADLRSYDRPEEWQTVAA